MSISATESTICIAPSQLGNPEFKAVHRVKYAYVAGSMYRGIASKELVIAMAKAGMIGFLGTGGMNLNEIDANIKMIQSELDPDFSYGMNLLHHLHSPIVEMNTVELYLQRHIKRIEASAFMKITPALALFRLRGLTRSSNGAIECNHHIFAKVSRPEVARAFMSPVPANIINDLLAAGAITSEQAELGTQVPVAHDLCLEADSGGHTDQGVAFALMPAIQSLKNEIQRQYQYPHSIRIGLAGGIGTPESIAAAFILGADFILTGSINQCTVEAGISDAVKDMLQEINIQDTDYAPAGDMFEIGAKVQVLKKGVLFPARANKLYAIYRQYDRIEDIPETIRRQIEEPYFKSTFETVWMELKNKFRSEGKADEIEKLERMPKQKMAAIFRRYFQYSSRITFDGDIRDKTDFQIHTGPALGAFNQWVKGTDLESWRNRYVAKIAVSMMTAAAQHLSERISQISGVPDA